MKNRSVAILHKAIFNIELRLIIILKFTKKQGKQKFPVAERAQFQMKCGKIEIECLKLKEK